MICDAIKIAYRQSRDGFVVSFAIHPQDMPADLANADIGSQWQLKLVPLDEHGNAEKEVMEKPSPLTTPAAPAVPLERARPGKRWSEMKLGQQAAIRCGEPAFWKYLSEKCDYPAVDSKDDAAQAVRELCNVATRRDIGADEFSTQAWKNLDDGYYIWQRFPEVAA